RWRWRSCSTWRSFPRTATPTQCPTAITCTSGRREDEGPARRQKPCTAPTSSSRWGRASIRSEEHTSELQSRFDLVCRLLLGNKKSLQCRDGECGGSNRSDERLFRQ